MEKQSSKKQEADSSSTTVTKLRPIVYTASSFKRASSGRSQELLLLKALQTTSDPKELRRLIGVKTVADVYKTLDKMSMRKEYHRALTENGISFSYLVSNLKGVIDSAEKDADKIKALQTLLKSVGMDKYEEDSRSVSGTWEDALLRATSATKLPSGPEIDKDYEVAQPEIPEYIKKMQAEEKKLSDGIYD